MKLRKTLSCCLATLVLTTPLYANTINTDIYINSTKLTQSATLGEAYVTMPANRTMVPVRLVSEVLGYDVKWDNNTKTATISNGTDTVEVVLNKSTTKINGKSYSLDTPATSINDRIYVPLRFVGELLDCTVEYKNKAVYITTGGTVTTPETPSTDWLILIN